MVIALWFHLFPFRTEKLNTVAPIKTKSVQDEVSDSIVYIDKETQALIDGEFPREVINEKSFKVMQALGFNSALVHGKDEYGNYYGMLYYLYDYGETYDEVIKVPKGYQVMRYGVYRYTTTDGTYKTVPKIKIIPKE